VAGALIWALEALDDIDAITQFIGRDSQLVIASDTAALDAL
jgi:hypothetical protein